MPGILGVFDPDLSKYNKSAISETLDFFLTGITETLDIANGFISVSSLKETPLKGKRLFSTQDYIYCLSGDIVGPGEIPWHEIDSIFQSRNFEKFNKFQGNFVIACMNWNARELFLVSDRRSQYPIFFKKLKNGFIFSTDLSTFCRLRDSAEFNHHWLYTFLFFNFSISQETFLRNVYRLPPASVLKYSFLNSEIAISQYAKIFRAKRNLIYGKDSINLAVKTFSQTLPKYFQGSDKISCALTDGWDARTMLALAPDIDKIQAYTYGTSNCADIIGAKKTAKLGNIKHKCIYFDDNFVNNLPEYIVNTVYSSSGIQSILRSTLFYVYETLTNYGQDLSLIISGIALDELFRGNHASPTPISDDIADIFRNGKGKLRKSFWQKIVDDYHLFEDTIFRELTYLENNFGDFRTPEHHLLFKMYMQGPQYFSGELRIAENFSTVRVPSWDSKIIELAFSVKESALSFSSFTGAPRAGKSVVEIQANLLYHLSPSFAKISVRNTRPDIALKNLYYYKFYVLYSVLLKKFASIGKSFSPLEDWDEWLNIIHKDFINDLIFSSQSMIKNYIRKDFMNEMEDQRNTHWIGKLATAEIILRLIKNKWNKIAI